MIDHKHHVEEIDGLALVVLSKADVDHDHPVEEISGLKDLLDQKADKQHTHSISEIFELDSNLSNSLMTYLRQAFTPSIRGSVRCSSKRVALVVNILSTYGYSMSTVSVEFRYRLTSTDIWISCDPIPFVDNNLRYAVELDVKPGSYVFEALLSDEHNPELKCASNATSFVIT